MKVTNNNPTHYFLSGGGEMGELTRSFDWSKTSIGDPDQWPHSLKTTLGIILHSAFPMFLFWGEDLICFYNDAYSPSLGNNGKHPALGKKAIDVWPEIWGFISPIIKQVFETNEAAWYEDQLLPIYRNGRMEDAYWTFNYSPVFGDDGKINGVLVTCNDTTQKVLNQKRFEESELQFRTLIEELPVAACVLKGKDFIVEVANEMSINSWGKGPNILGKPLTEVLPEIVNQSQLQVLYDVYSSGISHSEETVPYTLMVHGIPKSYIKKLIYSPLRDSEGNIHSILGIGIDVSERIQAQQALESSLQQLVSYFEQSPVAIATINKENLTFQLVNAFYAELVGRKPQDLIKKPMLVAIPELKGQGFDLLLEEVIRTGEAYNAVEVSVDLLRQNKLEKVYVNLTYQPQIGIDGDTTGILVVATDVTQQVLSRKKVEVSELKLRKVIEESPVATALFKGKELVIDIANEFVIEMYGQGPDIIGKPLKKVLQNGDEFIKLLENTFETGLPYVGKEGIYHNIVNGVMKTYIMDFMYKPLRDADGNVESILAIAIDVTEQAFARKKVEQSEEKLRTIVANAPAAIALFTGRDLIIEIPNQTFIDVAGKGPDIVGKPLAEAVPELKGQPFLDMLDEVFTTGKTLQTHGSLIKIIQHGIPVERYYDFTYTPVFDSDGKVYAILDIAIDVTEQMLDRHKLENSEQEIRSLIESSPFPIAVYIGKEMRIQLANQNIMDVWGKGNDVIGKLFSEILPELDNQQIFEQLDSVYTTGIPFHAKNQRVDLVVDNRLQSYYFNYSFTPLFDGAGNVYGVMNTAAEVTDLNLAKQRIEQSEQNLRNMILQAPVAMCILTGANHIIEIANDFMIELWGKPKDAVMNLPVFDALPDARGQGLEAIMRDVYENGTTFKADEMPVRLVRNGKHETVYQNFVYEPYREDCGKIIGVLSVTIDVTAQVLARIKIEEIVGARTRELATANDKLQKSNAELAQFAYIASHDLQEPLRKISMFTQLLEGRIGSDLDDQSKKQLSKISNGAIRMNTLIKDVLAYSDLIKETVEFTPVNLSEIIQNTLIDFELLIEQKNASIQCQPLPIIEAIPLQMAQLFGNLISNSLKFSRTDMQPVITISYSFLTKEEIRKAELDVTIEYYKISVCDNGIGLKAEHTEQIFNIFQRLHRKADYDGTGIGLAMCKKITINHHGNINATGSSEKGAVFNIMLPVKQQRIIEK